MTFLTGQLVTSTQKWEWQKPQQARLLRGLSSGRDPCPAPRHSSCLCPGCQPTLPVSSALSSSRKLTCFREQKKSFDLKKKPQRDSAAHQPPCCERSPRQTAPQEGRGWPSSPWGGRGAPATAQPGGWWAPTSLYSVGRECLSRAQPFLLVATAERFPLSSPAH